MKRTLQAFSLGLLIAGLIMVTTSLFSNYESTSPQSVEDLDVDEVIDIMKEQGYRVVTESEYISLSLAESDKDVDQSPDSETNESEEEKEKNNDKDKKTNQDEKDDEKNKDEKEEKNEIIKYTLHIKDGMPSSDIGDLLEENDIIDDGSKFNKFLEDEDYSTGVQLGKFKVNSDMSFKEIAKTFTR